MTMKKKLLTTLSVVLILGLAALGILAYLTDTDSDVNVMTLGNVDIEQNEYQRVVENGEYETATIDGQNSYVLEKFDQDKALLPATEVDANGNPYNYGAGTWDTTTVRMSQVDSYGGMQVFESKNAQDKFVVVTNNGKTDAYVRTLVAIEVGSADADLIGTSYHSTWSSNKVGTVTIDGNNYYVYEYVYLGGQLSGGSWRHENGVLTAGDTAYPNLSQVYLQAKATNEDMVAIDGNKNGKLDILVLSQAVQADGFENAQIALDTAFGKTSEKAAEWFGGEKFPGVVNVDSTEKAQAALNNAKAGDVIQLTAGHYDVLKITPVEGSQTTVLNSTTGYLSRSINGLTIKGEPGVTVDGIQVSLEGSNGNTISLNNIVIDGIDFTGVAEGFVCTPKKATIKNFTMQNCTMTSGGGKDLVKLRWPENVTVTNCEVDGAARLLTTAGAKNVTVTNNTIKNVTKVGINISDEFDGYINSGTIVISNNVYSGTNNTARPIRCAHVDDAKLIITDNQTTGYYAATGSDKDYIKITTKDESITPDVTITGNKYYKDSQKLHISVNGVEYKQSTPDTLN